MSEEQTHLLHQEILKALRDANQAQNGIAKPAEPARKPMSLDECLKGWELTKPYGHTDRPTFIAGVRFAEKHHKIGEE